MFTQNGPGDEGVGFLPADGGVGVDGGRGGGDGDVVVGAVGARERSSRLRVVKALVSVARAGSATRASQGVGVKGLPVAMFSARCHCLASSRK